MTAGTADDKADFGDLREAFTTFGISAAQQQALLQVVAGILLLGNVEFEGDDETTVKNAEVTTFCCFAWILWGVALKQLHCDGHGEQVMAQAADVLGFTTDDLTSAITNKFVLGTASP